MEALRHSHAAAALALVLVAGCQEGSKTESPAPVKASAEAARPAPSAKAAPSASSAPAKAGASAQAGCPAGMVGLPTGTFSQGSERAPGEGALDERPVRQVTVSAFCLDKTEVTAGAYAACSDAGACTRPMEKDPPYVWAEQFTAGKPERKDHPVNGVSFEQAQAYCKHAGKRLPSEAEWEFAARGAQDRIHPWGEEAPAAKLLNACDSSCRAEGQRHKLTWNAMVEESDGFATTAPVGSFPAGATPEGVLDLEGNVSEWVEGAPCPHDRPTCDRKGNVARGSSWLDQFPGEVRTASRRPRKSAPGYATVGFRCAR